MALIDKLKQEIDRAGKAAQDAFDEGKVRLEAFRARQLADRAAQALGYAVFRAKQGGGELDNDTYTRLAATLARHDGEAAKYEAQIDQRRRDEPAAPPAAAPAADAAAATPGTPAADATGGSEAAPPPGSTS